MKLIKFLMTIVLILGTLSGMIYIYARYIEPRLLIVNQVKLQSAEVKGHLKIAFFGDTHVGEFTDAGQLKRIVEKINDQNPDLVIFTGDLIDANGQFSANSEEVALTLQQIQAPYGKYCVIGNHEYALAKKYDYETLMKAAGFQVLINDWLDISEINVRLLGLDDAYLGKPDKMLSENAREGSYNILMTHEPDIVDQMNLDEMQLVLAGHTHGGQISIPLITNKILPSGGRKYIKGIYYLGSARETVLFVTKGTGMTKLPLRFMNVPEIVTIDISPK